MWQRTAIVVALGLSSVPCAVSFSEEIRYSELLISDLNWVAFDVAMGRILATGSRTKQDRPRGTRELPDGAKEAIAVTLDRGLVSVHYEYLSATRQLVIRVVRGDRVEVESTCHDAAGRDEQMSFVQRPDGDVTLTVQVDGASPGVYEAASLWHLELAHPDVCRAYFNDALHMFRPNWRIESEVAEIRSSLLACDPARVATSRREVELLVTQLTSDDFRLRQRSARELRARGRNVLGFLQELDPATLDAEQRLRVESVQQAIIADYEDTPERVVAWLLNDKSAWLALLNDESPACRTRANSHLARLCDHPIDFDPGATSETRLAQLADLRSELLRR
jgi:hypothetical protein